MATIVLFSNYKNVFAEDYNSSSFKVLDPIMTPSGYASSTGFQLWSNISEVSVGTSSSGSFTLGSGFLRYPLASSPTVGATAGDSQVALSWTASTGFLGWTASSYSIGQSVTSNGPYSYTSLGDVLTSTVTGLSNGTTYYFVIRVKDIFGNFIASSTEISSTPVASGGGGSGGGSSGGGGGGGGGGGSGMSSTPDNISSGVIFTGKAYPKSVITLLKDAQVVATTIAGTDANFQITVSGISTGSYLFSVYSEDSKGTRSSLLTFPVSVTSGVVTRVGGIFIAPTISVDKKEVKKGDNIAIFGQSTPSADIVASVNSEQEHFIKDKSDSNGVYLLNFDTSVLEMGQHHTKSKSILGNEISEFSSAVGFIVGTKTVLNEQNKCNTRGDSNSDCRVNLVDFSIAAFWYKKASPLASVDLNRDGKVDLIDFSIMAFNWTG